VVAVELGRPWISPDFAAVLVPVDGSTVSLDPTAERALVLYAAGLPESMIAARIGVDVEQVRLLLEVVLQAYGSPTP
jgi:hypothetical protein